MKLQNLHKEDEQSFKTLSDASTELKSGEVVTVKCSELPENRVLNAGIGVGKIAAAGIISWFLWNNRKNIQKAIEQTLGI